jgi:hypothetical protein
MAASTFINFKTTVLSAESINENTLKHKWTSLVMVISIALFSILIIYGAHELDEYSVIHIEKESKRNYMRTKLVSTFQKTILLKRANNALFSSSSSPVVKRKIVKDLEKNMLRGNLSEIEKTLPPIHSTESLGHKLSNAEKDRHKWLSIIFLYNEHYPRSLRAFLLVNEFIIILFVNAVLYNLTNPDNGECQYYYSQNDCLKTKSSFNSAYSKCKWEKSSCSFNAPEQSVEFLVYISIIGMVLTIPLKKLFEFIMNNVLLLQNKSKKNLESKYLDSNFVNTQNHSNFTNVEIKKKPLKTFEDESLVELEKICYQLKAYRELLSTEKEKLQIFDGKNIFPHFFIFLIDYCLTY